QPVLGALGGVAGLRARLHSPGTTVQEMEGERALVTLGQWPEAGDLAQGRDLPAYRELARVLEPWSDAFFPGYVNSWRGYTEEEVRRWWRRFLD
ncbi:type VI immunity family protein, partial [Archangium sp.]|uniref:type VI immunity family protein n=1 Tax=Archangium sp. TaxID=1872627 RepID=UPI002D599024